MRRKHYTGQRSTRKHANKQLSLRWGRICIALFLLIALCWMLSFLFSFFSSLVSSPTQQASPVLMQNDEQEPAKPDESNNQELLAAIERLREKEQESKKKEEQRLQQEKQALLEEKEKEQARAKELEKEKELAKEREKQEKEREKQEARERSKKQVAKKKDLRLLVAELATNKFIGNEPIDFGENIAGVTNYLQHVWSSKKLPLKQRHGSKTQTAGAQKVEKPSIALTINLTGEKGNYDKKLLEFLEKEAIPVSFFVSRGWIRANKDYFLQLAEKPHFEFNVLGAKPATIRRKKVQGLTSTSSLSELVKEVEENSRYIEELTGLRPRWFRASTGYYDDVAVSVIRELGYGIAGYSLSIKSPQAQAKDLVEAFKHAQNGDIIMLPARKGESNEQVYKEIEKVRQKGFNFVPL